MTIDEAALRSAYAELRARVVFLERASGLFVDEADLEKRGGDPKVHFDPRSWKGPSGKGKAASQCAPDFLYAYAEALTWMADHPKDDPGKDPKDLRKQQGYNRLDAARCRAWARRIAREVAKKDLFPEDEE